MGTQLNILSLKVLTTLYLLEGLGNISIEDAVNGIFGLASTIKDFDVDDFLIYKEDNEEIRELKEESATGYLIDRLEQAYADGRIREQYLEELHKEEKWELLAKIVN